jgi:dipeptidyl aminopeptidase/acylaminoacyl peptidase
MKKILLFTLFFVCKNLLAQDGSIIDKQLYTVHDTIWKELSTRNAVLVKNIKENVDFYRITYKSDGLKVIALMAEPKSPGKYPCIISNRGGNRDQSKWNSISIPYFLGQMASWNYVVIGSQYRGNDGGEGKEEFGGKDVNDVINLIPVLEKLPKADTSRIGIDGTSRGGMMTYLALKKTCRFKAAVVTSGMADAFINTKSRPEMDKNVFGELVPDYATNKDAALKERSAVFWADQLCKTTPLLIMHGSSDWRVPPEEALEMVQKLYESKHPLRFILFDGADHFISEWRMERFEQSKKHFDYYLRDGNKLPNMEKHGR